MSKMSYLSDESLKALNDFNTENLTRRIAHIENQADGVTLETCQEFLSDMSASHDAIFAAKQLKALAGQINVSIHALGILRCLPHILEAGEVVESMSLGAGNTGKSFDLETSQRVAEFKFINWKGGAEAIRQNGIFKDFYGLAEAETVKSKHLYLLGVEHAMKFFNGGRSLKSVLSKNRKIADDFDLKYGQSVRIVRDYFALKSQDVSVEDVSHYVPELIQSAFD